MADKALLDLLEQMVKIDSTNPDLIPGAVGEDKLARFIAEWCTRAGLDVQLQEVVRGRPNVIARARGTGGGKTLMLNGHMDTVGWTDWPDALKPAIKDGRMYGRGGYDMKAGLAACMTTAAQAARLNLRGDVVFTAVVDEEYASIGTQKIAQTVKADAAIVAEFTELQLILAHKGFVVHEVETIGHAYHGSRPDMGIDAIAKMGAVLTRIEALGRKLTSNPTHPLLGSGSVHAGLISGGQEMSSYPAQCKVTIERRTIPGETLASARAELDAILADAAAADPQFRAAVRHIIDRAPLETPADAPIVRAVQAAASKATGKPAPIAGVAFWADTALLADAGITSVMYGPAGSGAHSTEEWVDLASMQTCADVYLQVARDFCA